MPQADEAVPLPLAAARPGTHPVDVARNGRPFFLFALLFLVAPDGCIWSSEHSRTPEGDFTLENLANLSQPSIVSAYTISLQVSAASALGGGPWGLASRRRRRRSAASRNGSGRRVVTFSGVASNFAGMPLAFAFLATLGRTGLVTTLLVTLLRLQHLRGRASIF